MNKNYNQEFPAKDHCRTCNNLFSPKNKYTTLCQECTPRVDIDNELPFIIDSLVCDTVNFKQSLCKGSDFV